MIRWLSNKILHLMKVPAEPQLPDGSAGSARVFRSGRNYYRWRLTLWFSANLGVVILLGGVLFALARPIKVGQPWSRYVAEVAMTLLVSAFVVSAFFTFLQQRMNYELRWYVTVACAYAAAF